MPLIAHSDLPTFERLRAEGETVLDRGTAEHQDIRELHIGLLNMMPDAALAATERQFFRLVNDCNQIAQFYIHPFTFKELQRGEDAQKYVNDYYESFEQLKKDGLDALIITGANISQADLSLEPFWEPLTEVIDWAYENVTSTLCSCLASHAVLQQRHNIRRQHMGNKLWGVFEHRVTDPEHPLVFDVNTRFDVPHSRYNQVTRQQLEQAGLKVLVAGEQAGVHLAVSEDLFRIVYFQGHPEYDTISLLKEYKREINRFIKGDRQDYPPFPENYFRPQSEAILSEFRKHLERALASGAPVPAFPEKLIVDRLDNTWHDTAEAVLNNWIGKVYQITNQQRNLPFMDNVDPQDPLCLRSPSAS